MDNANTFRGGGHVCRESRPARGTPPGRILSRRLDARGWTQRDLAKIMGRPVQAINEIIQSKKQITPETALQLAEVFGTSRIRLML